MLSIETEAKIAKLLVALSQGEHYVETSRQVLCNNIEFDAYQVFQELDIEGKNTIDAYNISNFLKRRNIFATLADIQFIIRFYDLDNDGSLSYGEFLHFVQSSTSFKRNTKPISDKMSYNVEYSLGKIIEKELELARRLSVLIGDIKYRYDFNLHDIFHLLKSWNTITSESLKAFLCRNHLSHFECDIRAIMKRLDVNRDNRVDLIEFSGFFGCPMCTCGLCSCCCCTCCHHLSHYCPSNHNSPLRQSQSRSLSRSKSIERTKQNEKEDNNILMSSSITNNAFKSTYQTMTPERNPRDTINQSIEIKKVSPNLTLRLSPERRFSPKRTMNPKAFFSKKSSLRVSNTNKVLSQLSSSQQRNIEEDMFIDYLRIVMNEESNIEKMKIDLALRNDFNVEDAFRIFELNKRDYLTEEDLKYGLSLLDIFSTDQDTKILMKRFDLQGKGVLNYADFFDMIIPYEKDYRTMVENRLSNSCCACKSLDSFSYCTKTYLQSLIRNIISMENKFNTLKSGFTSLRWKLKQIFPSIDLLNRGYFTEEDLERYLKLKKAFSTTKDSDLLFIHLDKNRNGQVEYWEVSDALTPI